MDLIIIAYYFLMRPGEYCTSTGQDSSHPFHLDELELWLGPRKLNLATATDHELLTATFCMLKFSDQKNANRGEQVGHATSGDYIFCPVRALTRRVIHLRKNNAPPHTPIHCYYEQFRGRQLRVPASSINLLLRHSATLLGLDPADITIKALRASGAMALITARIDSDLIRLLGRWQSDAMLRYLHVQAVPVIQNFARAMNLHGNLLLAFRFTSPSPSFLFLLFLFSTHQHKCCSHPFLSLGYVQDTLAELSHTGGQFLGVCDESSKFSSKTIPQLFWFLEETPEVAI
jgi:hypothetical protein